VQFVARHVDHVPHPHVVRALAQRDPGAPGHDHHAVIMRMALVRGSATRWDLEIAHPVLARALGLADQLMLAYAGQRWVGVAGGPDAPPPAGRSGPGMVVAHLYAPAGVPRGGPTAA